MESHSSYRSQVLALANPYGQEIYEISWHIFSVWWRQGLRSPASSYLNVTENEDRFIQTVLEPAMRQGKCLRVADNLITEGNTPDEAAKNYELIGTSGGVAVSRRQAVDLQRR